MQAPDQSRLKLRAPTRRQAALTLAAGAAGLLLSACSGADKGATKAAPAPKETAAERKAPALLVTVAAVRSQMLSQQLTVDAELSSLSSPNIATEVSAKVQRVLVKPGEVVRKGQVLAQLEDLDLSLSAAETRAQLSQLEASLADKTRALARAEELFAKEYVSKASRDEAVFARDASRAQVDAARAKATLSERSLAKAQVVAPFDGTVLDVKTAPGAYARAGDVLFQLWSPQQSTLRLRIPQDYLGQVRPAQEVILQHGSQELKSTLTRVNTSVQAASRSFEAHAAIPQELAGVSGLSLAARIQLSPRQALVVPAQAPQLEAGKALLVLVKDGKAQKVPVELGIQQDGVVEVLAGVEEGAQVVVEGAAFANQGQPVQVREVGEVKP